MIEITLNNQALFIILIAVVLVVREIAKVFRQK